MAYDGIIGLYWNSNSRPHPRESPEPQASITPDSSDYLILIASPRLEPASHQLSRPRRRASPPPLTAQGLAPRPHRSPLSHRLCATTLILFAFSDHIHPSLAPFPPNTRPASSIPPSGPKMDLLSSSDSNSVQAFSGGADVTTWLQDSLSAVDAWPERAEWRVLVFQIHKVIHMASLSPSLFAYHPVQGDASSPNLDHPTAPLLRCAFQRFLYSLLLLISHLPFFLLI